MVRKSPYYSDEISQKISIQLYSSIDKWNEVSKVINDAADIYLRFKEQKNKALTPKAGARLVKSYIEAYDKAEKIWQTMMGDFYIRNFIEGNISFHKAFKSISNNQNDTQQEDVAWRKESALLLFKRYNHELGMPPQLPLQMWLEQVARLFQNSNIKFTQGKYYKTTDSADYSSKCLDLLCDLMRVIDSKVKRTNIADKIVDLNQTLKGDSKLGKKSQTRKK